MSNRHTLWHGAGDRDDDDKRLQSSKQTYSPKLLQNRLLPVESQLDMPSKGETTSSLEPKVEFLKSERNEAVPNIAKIYKTFMKLNLAGKVLIAYNPAQDYELVAIKTL